MPTTSNLPERRTSADVITSISLRYPVVPPDELEGRTLVRTLTAETATAVLAAPESVALDDITGEPFWLMGISFFTYSQVKDRENDLYVYLDCYWDDGRGFSATTGSPFVISRVHRLSELGVLPRRVMSILVESRRNSGQSSLWIVEAPLSTSNGPGPIIEASVAD